jgi:hypothetical protein
MARFVVGVPLILLLVSVAFAQNPPHSDPHAVLLVTHAISALTNGVAVRDITLSRESDLDLPSNSVIRAEVFEFTYRQFQRPQVHNCPHCLWNVSRANAEEFGRSQERK